MKKVTEQRENLNKVAGGGLMIVSSIAGPLAGKAHAKCCGVDLESSDLQTNKAASSITDYPPKE